MTPESVDQTFLRDRVRLYIAVMLVIDVAFHVLGAVVTQIVDRPNIEIPTYMYVIRWCITVALVLGWAYCAYGAPRRRALLAIESVGTAILGVAYVKMMNALPLFGPVFGLFNVTLALVLRASLVPSSVQRTFIVGVLAIGFATLGMAASKNPPPAIVSTWFAIVGGGFLAATAVTSHVIYGLRREVRAAQRLGQYELVRKIGEGGMGVVYEATHVLLRRPTAVKLLPIDQVGELTVARFEREVQQTSRLEHPNSVFIYDYGRTPDGQFYYAMEYLDGLTLQELIDDGGPISCARALGILGQAAHALAEAHAMGLVHRDIKPANVMLCERGRVPDTVKVLDFGLVKAVDGAQDVSLTQADSIVGTPQYMSPESIKAPGEVTAASDVYALGALGYFLITGRPVFGGESVIEVCSKHLSEEPVPPSRFGDREIDSGLEDLILRCLAKSPEDRPANGEELAAALDALSISGWSSADARAWWGARRAATDEAAIAEEAAPSGRTHLAVELADRAAPPVADEQATQRMRHP